MISIDTIKQIVQLANKLSEFYVSRRCIPNQIDENDYNNILPVVLARQQHQKLTMTFKKKSIYK